MGKLEKRMAVDRKRQEAKGELDKSKKARTTGLGYEKSGIKTFLGGDPLKKDPSLKEAKSHADKAYKAAKEAQRLKKRDAKAFKDGYYHE